MTILTEPIGSVSAATAPDRGGRPERRRRLVPPSLDHGCGFSPFSDDTSTTRDIAFATITARVRGTARAANVLRVA